MDFTILELVNKTEKTIETIQKWDKGAKEVISELTEFTLVDKQNLGASRAEIFSALLEKLKDIHNLDFKSTLDWYKQEYPVLKIDSHEFILDRIIYIEKDSLLKNRNSNASYIYTMYVQALLADLAQMFEKKKLFSKKNDRVTKVFNLRDLSFNYTFYERENSFYVLEEDDDSLILASYENIPIVEDFYKKAMIEVLALD